MKWRPGWNEQNKEEEKGELRVGHKLSSLVTARVSFSQTTLARVLT